MVDLRPDQCRGVALMKKIVLTSNPNSAFEIIKRKAFDLYGDLPSFRLATTIDDLLNVIPVLSKDRLSELGELNFDKYLKNAILFGETSGTTGSSLATPRSSEDLEWNVLNHIIAYKEFLTPGVDRVAVIHPSVLSPFVEATCMALKQLGVGYARLFPIEGICSYQRIYDVICRYKLTTIMTTPSLAYKSLYEMVSIAGKTPEPLNKVLLTGEKISRENIRNMSNILKAGHAHSFVYGSSETAVVMTGTKNGNYKPLTNDFVLEFVDIKKAQENKLTGRLLVTWLREGLLPILRYDSGDYFAIDRQKDNTCFMECIGRENQINEVMFLKLEKAVYSMPYPIYHFEYLSSCNKLYLITDNKFKVCIYEYIKNINLFDEVDTIVNPEDHEFYRFSPKAKINRLTN